LQPAESTEPRIRIYAETFLGGGRYMNTTGGMKLSGEVFASTRTRTVTSFGGFRGSVKLLFNNAQGIVIDVTRNRYVFGVDGTLIGTSDRIDAWSERINPSHAANTQSISVLHTWDPNSFDQRMADLQAIGKKTDSVIQAVRTIAKVVTLFL
jgi:hypothetical protein